MKEAKLLAENPPPQSIESTPSPRNSASTKRDTWNVKTNLIDHNSCDEGVFSLAPGEVIVGKWVYKSSSFSLTEWIASILSLGLYYFISRVLLKRARSYAVAVTNMNVHVKEEMSERSYFFTKTVFENQISHPLSSLAYVCAEEMEAQFCGLFPSSVCLEMRFHRYPLDSEVPLTPYHSIWHYIRIVMGHAATYAFKNAFNVNFDSSPVVLAIQLMQAIPLMSLPQMWILWTFWAAVDLCKQLFTAVAKLVMAAMLSPVIGPLQAIGKEDGRVCKFAVDVSEDADCHKSMRSVLKAINLNLPDRHVAGHNIECRLKTPPSVAFEGDPGGFQNINRKKPYGEDNEFQVLGDYCDIPAHEQIIDICPVNPYWTFSEVKMVVLSLGLYYFSDLMTIMAHRINSIFTTRRHIQHSVLLSFDKKSVAHSRLEYWVLEASSNVVVTEFRRETRIHVTSRQFGWTSFRINKKASSYFMFMFRTIFHPRIPSSHVPGLCTTPMEDWLQNPQYEKAKLTRQCFTRSEVIDVAMYADQRLFSGLVKCVMSMLCLLRRYEAVVTCTNECLYIEYVCSKTCASSSKVFVVIPWCDVDGVYWQNHDAGGPNCMMSWMLSCMFPLVFGCCCCVCSGAPENKDTYFNSSLGGHKGCQVSICPRNSRSFRLGIAIPNRYYGMQDKQVNALVDSISHRAIRNIPLAQVVGVDTLPPPPPSPSHVSVLSDEGSATDSTAGAQPSAPVAAVMSPAPTFVVNAVQQSVHHGQYVSPNKHNGDPRTMNRAGCKLHFPIGSRVAGCFSLTPGERVIKEWRTETTRLESWEVILAFLTFGIYYFYRMVLFNVKRFLTLRITNERILINEEIIMVRFFVLHSIFENQAAFRLEDLCYVNAMEIGPSLCCIPSRTFLSMRFGQYPFPADVPHSADTGSQKSRSDRSWFTIAHVRALARVYGIYEEAGSAQSAEQEINNETSFFSWSTVAIDYMHYLYVVIAEITKQFFHLIWEVLQSIFTSRNLSSGASHLSSQADARHYSFFFKTSNAVAISRDIVNTLSALVSEKRAPLNPSGLGPIASPRYEVSDTVTELNRTDKYGKDGGFFVMKRMWSLLDGETVLDVIPTNYKMTIWDMILTVLSAGMYYVFRIYGRRRCRQSFMVTDRRLISHSMRKACCGSTVIYSCLQMWFLAPTLGFTIVRKKKSCCKYRSDFISDSTRFGVLNLNLHGEQFMCNFLRVVSATESSPSSSKQDMASALSRVAEMDGTHFSRIFLEAGNEQVAAALGSVLPVSCLSKLGCSKSVKMVLIVTPSAILLEMYTKSSRVFTRIPIAMVRAVFRSNFETKSALCFWRSASSYKTHVMGYSGSQLRLNLVGSRSFRAGIVLPGRYYGGDRDEDEDVTAMAEMLTRHCVNRRQADVMLVENLLANGVDE